MPLCLIDRNNDSHCKRKNKKLNNKVEYIVADLRDFKLERQYDNAVAMFAVTGYINTNYELQTYFNNVYYSLKLGGLFIFDTWHGPAVLTQKPSERQKIVDKSGNKTIRFASSQIDIINNTVDVNYHIIEINNNLMVNEIHELHRMRYFFACEMDLLLKGANFQMLGVYPFLEFNKKPTENDWNVTFVAQKF